MTPVGPRILAAGLGGAALYAGILSGAAAAQDPAPAATPTATASPAASPVPASTSAGATGALPAPAPAATAPNTASSVSAPPPVQRVTSAAPRGLNVAAGAGSATPVAPRKRRRAPAPAPAAAAPPAHRAGAPAPATPGYALALPGAAPIGVPDFFIDKFRIPPFLLPIYQAAGSEYGVRWEVLAAINEIETDYGRNVHVSSAGARGWMQFMPATWRTYGVDANRDGRKDPLNPVDAIFSAARYLKAAGASTDLRGAVLAYNHAGWYADSVLMRARIIGGMPADLVGSLTGLTEGRFPVGAKATYAGGAAREIRIFSRPWAPVVAVNDGRVIRLGTNRRLGRFLVLRDVYGNRFTYGNLGRILRVRRHAAVRRGTRLVGGTVFARLGTGGRANLTFAIRPGGRGAPRIPPRPILDGWKLLESTAAYRAAGRSPFPGAEEPSIGAILLLSHEALIRSVLASPRIELYACGREDIRAGRIDRRVLATMLYLAASGLRPSISSLECGHSRLTTSGNVSEHSTGTAMDIAAINGIRISPATQGPGSIADVTIQRLLTLQGVMKPHQIISLNTFAGTDNTLAMADHADHIHVGWSALYGQDARARQRIDSTLQPHQWIKLIDRIEHIGNPAVPER